jgi:hypothetical protein
VTISLNLTGSNLGLSVGDAPTSLYAPAGTTVGVTVGMYRQPTPGNGMAITPQPCAAIHLFVRSRAQRSPFAALRARSPLMPSSGATPIAWRGRHGISALA